MLKQLKIKKFQLHEHTVLEFSNGLNVIVGDSQAGKSQILKAFSYLCFHDAKTRNPFPNNGKVNKLQITGKFDDGNLNLTKKKSGKEKSEYRLGNELYREFGRRPPEEIVDFVNLADLNFQWSWDPNFLVFDTPGTIGRKINEFIDLDSIDRWLKKLNSNIDKNKRVEKELSNDIEKFKNDLRKYENLDRLDKLIKDLERKESEKQTLFRQINQYENDLITWQKLERQEKLIDIQLNKLKDIYDKIVRNEEKKDKIVKEKKLLEQHLKLNIEYDKLEEEIKKNKNKYEKLIDGFVCPIFDIECERGK